LKAWTKLTSLLPSKRRAARTAKCLQIEQSEYGNVVARRRRAVDEEIARITLEHNQRYVGNVQAPGLLERALLPTRVEYLRGLFGEHFEIRQRLGKECPDLLTNASLKTLEDEMIRSVEISRVVRDDEFKMRVAASGIPERRPLYRDDAEYGEVIAYVRRRVQQLRLSNEVGLGKPSGLTRDQKINIGAVIVAVILGIITIALTLTVPEVRRFIGLDKPPPATPATATPSK